MFQRVINRIPFNNIMILLRINLMQSNNISRISIIFFLIFKDNMITRIILNIIQIFL